MQRQVVMVAFIVLIGLFLIAVPPVLSMIALYRVSALKKDVEQLRALMQSGHSAMEPPSTTVTEKTIRQVSLYAKDSPIQTMDSTPEKAISHPAVLFENTKGIAGESEKEGNEFELLLGGRAAAFAGIGILVAGIAFLVGYAVQHAWIGPGVRTLIGLVSGCVLVGLGHYIERRQETYRMLARVMTGGGSALFYFTVYAAYGLYHLIGVRAAGAGLLGSALAVFGLALAYRSQAVAVLGVVGAFITPLLIGSEKSSPLFMLLYGAVVNVPVIMLGIRRKWQTLYNLAFVFSVIYYVIALDGRCATGWMTGLCFALLFFAEYAVLGLLKLRSEQQITGRIADIVRLLAASILLMIAVYSVLDDAGLNHWTGAALLTVALMHMTLAFCAFKLVPRFSAEILTFLAGGLIGVALAIPAQYDGVWVSLGWSLEGLALSWFASRIKSQALRTGALITGILGLMKALLFSAALYTHTPDLFLNARFIIGMLSALMLSVQGTMAGRFAEDDRLSCRQDVLWWVGALGVLLVFFTDSFWILGAEDPFSWLNTSLALLAMGAALLLLSPIRSSVVILGSILLMLVPLKILIVDAWFGWWAAGCPAAPYSSPVTWIQLVILCSILPLINARVSHCGITFTMPSGVQYSGTSNMIPILSAIGLVSLETARSRCAWGSTAITIFWALSALGLILYGMKRWSAAYRCFGLGLFTLATFKVLVVDASKLKGMERIAAFIGTGVLLLLLSFLYQKTASYYQRRIRSNTEQG